MAPARRSAPPARGDHPRVVSRLGWNALCSFAPWGALGRGASRRCRPGTSGTRLCSRRCEADVEAGVLDPVPEPLRFNFGIVSELEELRARVLIEGAVGQQMPGDVQKRSERRAANFREQLLSSVSAAPGTWIGAKSRPHRPRGPSSEAQVGWTKWCAVSSCPVAVPAVPGSEWIRASVSRGTSWSS